jgi:hypothetical protein
MKSTRFLELFKKDYTDLFIYLYDRWEDEKEYEDIGEYLEFIQKKVVVKGVKILSISEDTFIIRCKCYDKYLNIGLNDLL